MIFFFYQGYFQLENKFTPTSPSHRLPRAGGLTPSPIKGEGKGVVPHQGGGERVVSSGQEGV
jgi:hypothetical protein